MKTLLTIIIAIYTYSLSNELAAQSTSKWKFGIAAGLGRTYYDRKYDEVDGVGMIPRFHSNYDWSLGYWGERHFNPRFSGLIQLAYRQTDILPDLFSQWYSSGFWYARETHHHGQAEVGMRWYINPRSKFIFFLEAKAGADMFLAATDHPFSEEKVTNRDAFGYDRILPAASAAAGIKWRRFALMADYGHDLLRARRDEPEKLGFMSKKTGILAQRMTVKATFTIFK